MKTIVYSFLIVLSFGCTRKPSTISKESTSPSETEISCNLVADTIIYDVVIRSTNPDDIWENERLQYLNHSALVDSLFDLVYEKEIIAYDVFENKALSVSQVKSLEEQADYARNRIGKIQFTEKWYFNSSDPQLQKEIISISLGYETYNEHGEVRAYKPVFKLYLN